MSGEGIRGGTGGRVWREAAGRVWGGAEGGVWGTGEGLGAGLGEGQGFREEQEARLIWSLATIEVSLK